MKFSNNVYSMFLIFRLIKYPDCQYVTESNKIELSSPFNFLLRLIFHYLFFSIIFQRYFPLIPVCVAPIQTASSSTLLYSTLSNHSIIWKIRLPSHSIPCLSYFLSSLTSYHIFVLFFYSCLSLTSFVFNFCLQLFKYHQIQYRHLPNSFFVLYHDILSNLIRF